MKKGTVVGYINPISGKEEIGTVLTRIIRNRPFILVEEIPNKKKYNKIRSTWIIERNKTFNPYNHESKGSSRSDTS